MKDTKTACRSAFTTQLLELARQDRDIIALTSDATGSVSLGEFAQTLPAQFVEVGIAEQDMVGISAGLATCGKKPFACGPASFMAARSYEQVKVDVAYSNVNVKLVGVSGGVSYGALGESHYSVQDIAALRSIANMTVLLPADATQTAALTRLMAEYVGPVYMRLGRGAVSDIYEGTENFAIGKAHCCRRGGDITIIAAGEMVKTALEAAELLEKEGIAAGVLDMFTLKPLDEAAILTVAQQCKAILTLEEHSVYGGLGAAVAQVIVENRPVPMKIMGLPSEVLVGGTSDEIKRHYGLKAADVVTKSKELLQRT